MKSAALCAPSLAFGSMLLLAGHTALGAMGSAFTYQGSLTESGNAANGSYDLKFCLYDAASGGFQVGAAVTNAAMAITNGSFTVALDFGANAFDGGSRWLEVAVRKDMNDFAVLSPRQPVTPAPYAMTAASLSAPLPDSQLPAGVARLYADQTLTGSNTFSGVVTAGNAANVFGGSFRGNGAGLTNLDTSVVTAATNDLNTALLVKIVEATNAPWIASTNVVAAATNDLNAALSAQIVAATNAPWLASTNLVATATNDLNSALVTKIGNATNDLNTGLTTKITSATNDLSTTLTSKITASTNNLNSALTTKITSSTNDLNTALTSKITASTNDLLTASNSYHGKFTGNGAWLTNLVTTKIVAGSGIGIAINDEGQITERITITYTGSGGNATNAVSSIWTNGQPFAPLATNLNLIAGANVTLGASNWNNYGNVDITIHSNPQTNDLNTALVAKITASTNDLNTTLSAKIMAATNAPWIASTNVVAAATNDLNTALSAKLVAATNAPWIASTNLVTAATNNLNTALLAKMVAATNDLNTALSVKIVAATNAPWIASTNLVAAATNDLNTALSAKLVASTNAPWIASTNLVATATNDLNTALSAKIVAATNAPWIASTNLVTGATNSLNTALSAKMTAATNDLNTALLAKIVAATNDLDTALSAKVVAATNDLNTALSAKVVAATNGTWIATTNWVGAQGYQVTNGLTRKAILSPVVLSGTNCVVDFSSEVVQMTATNNLNLVQSTNRTATGWYGECVWYIQGGTANWTLRVNTNWVAVGTWATNVPYILPSNKLTIIALSVRGSSETNVTYAIGRQE